MGCRGRKPLLGCQEKRPCRQGPVQEDELGQIIPLSSHSFWQGREPLCGVELIKNKCPGPSQPGLLWSCSISAYSHELWHVPCELCVRSGKLQKEKRLELPTDKNSKKYSRPEMGNIKTSARRSWVTLLQIVADTSLTLQENENKAWFHLEGWGQEETC